MRNMVLRAIYSVLEGRSVLDVMTLTVRMLLTTKKISMHDREGAMKEIQVPILQTS